MVSGWDPVPSGDYSSWASRFQNRVNNFCSRPNSFAFYDLEEDGASKSLLAALRTDSGVASLSKAMQTSSLTRYLWGKGGYIAFLIIGLVVFGVCVTLAFALLKCFRKTFSRFVCGACTDRPRYHPKQVQQKRRWVMTTLCITGLIGLLAASIVSFVYSARLMNGTRGMACDFWLSMQGYYFGGSGVKTPPGVAHDWKGSDTQRRAMEELRQLVDTHNRTVLSPLSQQIMREYEGAKGLKQSLITARDTVLHEGAKALFLAEAFEKFINFWSNNHADDYQTYDGGGLVTFIWPPGWQRYKLRYATSSAHLTATYINDFNKTMERGLQVFDQSLEQYLGEESVMLDAAYQTANTAMMGLSDVDYVMAGLTGSWDKSVEPTVFGVVRALVGISCSLGILGVLFSLTGSGVFWRLRKNINGATFPPLRLVKFLGVVYVVLLIFSGLSLLMSGVLLLLGSSGADACEYLNQSVYEKGHWNSLPASIFAHPNKTDIPTVLDTCVKGSGTGDVAASMGIRMLLVKLDQAVQLTESEILKQVDVNLQLADKSSLTTSLADLLKTAPYFIHGDPSEMRFAGGNDESQKYQRDFTGVLPFDKPALATFCPMDTLYNGTLTMSFGGIRDILDQLRSCWYNMFPLSAGAKQALAFLDGAAHDAGLELRFCSVSLERLNVCTAGASTETVLIDGAIDWSAVPSGAPFPPDEVTPHSPFLDGRVKTISAFLAPDHERHVTFLHVLEQLFTADVLMQLPLIYSPTKYRIKSDYIADFASALPGYFTDLKPSKRGVPFERILKDLLPLITCQINPNSPGSSTPPEECLTFGDALLAWQAAADKIAMELSTIYQKSTQGVDDFVKKTTLGTFEKQLQAAHDNLQNFDCQFVGSSTRQGVTRDLCIIMLPSAAALGIAAIFLFVFSGLGAGITWRVYHYYHNLEVCGISGSSESKLMEGSRGSASGQPSPRQSLSTRALQTPIASREPSGLS